MVSKRIPGDPEVEGVTPSEEDLAQVTPRDLYQISDIRFVMRSVAQLETKVDRLIDDVKEQNAKFAELGTKISGVDGRVTKVEACEEHTQEIVREIKEDFRKHRDAQQLDFRVLFGEIIFVALGLATIMAHGFKWF